MTIGYQRKRSEWRSIAAAKIGVLYEHNVIKTSSILNEVKNASIAERIKGERLDRFYRRTIKKVLEDSGITCKTILIGFLFGILAVILFLHFEEFVDVLNFLWEKFPTSYQVKNFFSKLTIQNLMNVFGNFGLRVSHLER